MSVMAPSLFTRALDNDPNPEPRTRVSDWYGIGLDKRQARRARRNYHRRNR